MGIASQKPIDIRMIGATLVASFHRANPPLIWRFDLEHNHSFSLALQGDDGDWELGLTSQKGEFQPVASFAVRDDAEQAFVKVEHMLAKGRTGWFKILLRGLWAIILLIVLGALVIGGGILWQKVVQIKQISGSVGNIENGFPNTQADTAAPPTPGTPVPADEFFNR
jgi:hypothetical protein